MAETKFGIQNKYVLRWRFDYVNKPSKFGLWSQHGPNASDRASAQSLEGLIYARVEGKEHTTRNSTVLAECAAQDFCFFQWEAAQKFNAVSFRATSLPSLIGLRMVTRHGDIIVYMDGSIKFEESNKSYQNFELFGR